MLDANPELGDARGRPSDGTLPIKRARYSALTKEEIERAFDELDELSYAARQRRRRPPGHRPDLGRDADPRGLARHPPLRLQLPLGRPRAEPDPRPDRRARARAPRPRRRSPSGSCSPSSSTPTAASRPTTRPTSSGRRRRPTRRSPAPTSPGTVKAVTARKNTRKPPTPYNTTAFTHRRLQPPRHHARAARCGSPRTSTWTGSSPTRGPTTPSTRSRCRPRELVSSLVRIKEFSAAAGLLDGELKPTRGKKETTDHPPIYPTQAIHPEARSEAQAPRLRAGRPPLPRHLQPADDHRVDPRRHRGRRRRPTSSAARSSSTPATPRIYTYARSADEEIPKLEEGQELDARRRALDRRQGDPAAVADLARAS